MRDGRQFLRKIDVGPGFPGNPLSREDHQKRFHDCLGFAKKAISQSKAAKIASLIENLEEIEDVRIFARLLTDGEEG
jgi:hypothetical protein